MDPVELKLRVIVEIPIAPHGEIRQSPTIVSGVVQVNMGNAAEEFPRACAARSSEWRVGLDPAEDTVFP